MRIIRYLFPENVTFRRQLMMSVAIGALCIALSAATLTALFFSYLLRNDAIANGLNITQNFARQSVLALLYNSSDTARRTANTALDFPYVVHVAIYDKNQTLLTQMGQAPEESYSLIDTKPVDIKDTRTTSNEIHTAGTQAVLVQETDAAWIFTASVYTEPEASEDGLSPFTARKRTPERLGHVYVSISKSGLNEIQRNIFWQNVITSLLFSGLLLLVLRLIINKLTQPLQALELSMHQSESGKTGLRADLQGSREIVTMAHAFNSMMAALDDRDQRLREHRDILESQVELRTHELVLARDQALQASRHKSEFLANISHELRTPMNAVIGYTDMLIETLEDEGNEENISDLMRIRAAGQHLLSLINSLLNLAKIEAGRAELNAQPTNIPLLISDTVGIIQPLLNNKNNNLHTQIEGLNEPISVDAEKLKQILLNLLSNANKFTHDGNIHMRAWQTADMLYLSVSDNGIGISPEDQLHIFEAFRQADMSITRNYGGTGLGLTITHRFCKLMGGDISVKSAPGEGTCFTLHIPLSAMNTAAT